MLIGYARVSTNEQETAMQIDALKAAGVVRLFAEKTSGIGPRPQLHRALAALRPGHTLVVYKVDRLARSLKDLLALLERLRAEGCSLRSLTEPVDTSSAMGELVLQILGAVAQFERSIIRERCEAGRRAAVERGVRFGRPVRLDGVHGDVTVALYESGLSIQDTAELLGVSSTAVRSLLLRAGVQLRGRGDRRF